MITLYGVTEDGTSVPVQVTDDGKLIVHKDGGAGDIECNSITAAGNIKATDGTQLARLSPSGVGEFLRKSAGSDTSYNTSVELNVSSAGAEFPILVRNSENKSDRRFFVQKDGSATASGSISAAGNKCGFTSDGELFFTSRNERYKAVVQGGNMMAEPYSRAIEIREKAAQLREPRTQDIVPED